MGFESILIMFFMIKHLICDFWLQNNWMASNKHKLNHKAGYVHAGINVAGTWVALIALAIIWNGELPVPPTVNIELLFILLMVGEFVLHFLTDYSKMNITKILNLQPMKHKLFWDLLGFDQFIHLAYLVFMASIIV